MFLYFNLESLYIPSVSGRRQFGKGCGKSGGEKDPQENSEANIKLIFEFFKYFK